jgi:hypothetical protein
MLIGLLIKVYKKKKINGFKEEPLNGFCNNQLKD